MTQTTDFERLLTSWMEADGPHDIPGRVVEAAFREARSIDQRRDITGAVLRLLPRTASPQTHVGRRNRLGVVLLVALLIALLAAGALLVGSQLLKPSPAVFIPADRGVFTPTGSMVVGRRMASATLLQDGRVLVIGGDARSALIPSAEIWDPLTAASSPTGSPAETRVGHTATLLRDGRVLVAGGDAAYPSSASAEIWDPASGTFSPTGSPAEARTDAAARLLPDGRVLVTGGYTVDADGNDVSVTSAEAWNPKTGAWSPADSLPEARYPTGTLLDDGRVLVLDGDYFHEGTGAARVWDPATGSSTPTGSFEQGVALGTLGTATRLLDGRVLLAGGGWWSHSCMITRPDGTCHGGASSYHPIVSAAIWDGATGLFSPTGSLSQELDRPAATLLLDGRVLVSGLNSMDEGGSAEVFELK